MMAGNTVQRTAMAVPSILPSASIFDDRMNLSHTGAAGRPAKLYRSDLERSLTDCTLDVDQCKGARSLQPLIKLRFGIFGKDVGKRRLTFF